MKISDDSAKSTSPIPMDGSKLAGKNLDAQPPLPEEIRLKGVEHTYESKLFDGEFIAFVWQGDDGILQMTNHPFDQFVQVLHGAAILTDEDGASQEFQTGDCFVLPKGYTGTWEIRDNYRELIMFESKAYKIGIGEFE